MDCRQANLKAMGEVQVLGRPRGGKRPAKGNPSRGWLGIGPLIRPEAGGSGMRAVKHVGGL